MTNSTDFLTAAKSADAVKARQAGLSFIDGSIPGYVLLMGDVSQGLLQVLESLRERQVTVFILEDSLHDSLRDRGFSLDWDEGLVPLSGVNAMGCIARIAQTFGNVEEAQDVLYYAQEKLYGFTLLLGEPTPERLEMAEAALLLGCPLISTHNLSGFVDGWEIPVKCQPAVGDLDIQDIVQFGIEERGMQIQVPIPELPVAYSVDFSGQVVRDDACGVCLSGVELVVSGENLIDGLVSLHGPDIDAARGGNMAYAMLVEISGREMQPDFEPVLERQIETIVNDFDGVMHRGQRGMVTLRIANKSIDKGLSIRHLGQLIHARLHNEYGNILSRVQISIFTENDQVSNIKDRAGGIFEKRDRRLKDLKDEEVDLFYSCNLCQTIAAGHMCVISPQHPGVCGAVDWMDARAAVRIRPVGPNKEIEKDGLLDSRLGQWESVNQIVNKETGGAMQAYSIYSLMEDPGTACGDFECITAMLPLTNGVMVIEHGHEGLTPSGMDWTTLYEMVGQGVPMPGFLGHSKRALGSEKFISAEGGWRRIVWMNHTLREEMRPALEALAAQEGLSGFPDMIATEMVSVNEDEILPYLEEVGHPALSMDPMI